MKTLYSFMSETLAEALAQIKFDVLSVERGQTDVPNDQGMATGATENYLRFNLEIPRGNGALSKIQFSVKLPDQELLFDADALDQEQVLIQLVEPRISFIDSRRNVYLKADSYTIIGEEAS